MMIRFFDKEMMEVNKNYIIGRNLILRKMEANDVNELIEICVYVGKFAETLEEAKEMIERINTDCRNGESMHWVICKKDDGKTIGTIGFYRGFANRIAEIGYIFKNNHRRKGYGREAVEMACTYALEKLPVDRIIAYTDKNNTGSIKVLEMNGFQVKGKNNNEIEYIKKELK
jgi:ribosomal-protein-alanine N-acetyltransferase